MAPRVINMLTAVRTREISLVRRGANNKRVALTKGSEMKFEELVGKVISTEAEGEDKLAETLRKSGKDDQAIEAAVAQYRLAQGFADQIDKESFAEIAKAAGFELTAKADVEPKPEPKNDPKPDAGPEIPEAVAKRLDDKDAKIAELTKSLDDEKRVRVRKELVGECESEFSHVPGMTADERADALLQAREAGGNLEETIRKQWADVEVAMIDSDLLRASGSPLRHNTGGAENELETIAKGIVETSGGKLTEAQAYDQALQQNPALYEKYLAENPRQSGER